MNAPIVKRTYHAAADLHHDDLDVIALLASGEELVVKRKTIVRRGQPATTIWRVRILVREPGRPLRFRYEDLPDHHEVTRWRPLDLKNWPDPLPAPARMMQPVNWQSKPEAPDA